MSGYDASIRVNTKVDNSDLKKIHDDFIEMEKQFGNLSDVAEDYETRLKQLRNKGFGPGNKEFDELYIAWKNSVNAEKEYLANLDKMTDKGMAEEAARFAREQEKQAEAQKRIEEKMRDETNEQERLKSLKESAVVSDERMVQLLQRQVKLKTYLNDLGKAGVTAGYEQYDNAANELQKINTEISERKRLSKIINDNVAGFEKLSNSSKKCFNVMQRGANKSNGLLKTLGSRLKGIALSLFVFNWITKGFNAMISAMKEGFKNLAKYSSDYNKAMSDLKSQTEQLKNGLAAAFEPIANMVIPYITQFVAWINSATEAMAKFLAILQGKNSYTRAKKQVIDYAKSLDTANKSAKRALASFDELNVLNQNDSGTGSASGELTGADAFEKANITEEDMKMFELVKEKLKDILGILLIIGAAMAIFGIGGPLSVFVGVLLTIIGLLQFIVEYMDAWENGISFENLKGMLLGLLAVITGIYLLFGPMAAGLALIVGGISLVVLAIKDMIDNGVNAQNSITLAIGLVAALVGIFVVFGATAAAIVGAIAAVISVFAVFIKIAGNGEEAIASLKSMCKNFADFFKKLFAGDIIGAMDSINMASKDLLNVLIISFESLINCIVKGLNWLIDKINSISFDVPDWVPIIGGDTLSPNIPRIPEASIPRLAGGAVIQGGRPFAAILGDQRYGQTNIEAPLATIQEALQNVMDRNGGNSEINLTVNLDGEVVYKNVIKRDISYQKQTGHSAFAY